MSGPAQYDVIVIGAGAGGMTAATVAAAEGLKVLLVEKSAWLGGTTAISGGMVWVPGNPLAAAVGHPDSVDAARDYLGGLVHGSHNLAVREVFLTRAAETIAYLERHSSVRLQPVPVYPDYYPDLPGASVGGRVLEPVPFDGAELGADFALVRPPLPEFTLFGGMMVSRAELPHFRAVFRSVRSTWRVARLTLDYARQRLRHPRGTSLVLGNALVARLVQSLRRHDVRIRCRAQVSTLLREGGAVRGVVVDGKEIRAARAVVLATGGFSHDGALREKMLPAGAGACSATVAEDAGDGIRLAGAAGARMETRGEGAAFWVPVSRFTRADGSTGLFPHTVTDRGKPGVIAVDRTGRRFVNEAVSYHEFVRAMLRTGNAAAGGDSPPAFLLCDRAFLWRYGLGAIRPMTFGLGHWRRTGYLIEAGSIPELAERLGLDAATLTVTVSRYNAAARRGLDPEFQRGANAYQRHMGDAAHRPNPCVGPIERPPFYAIGLYPGDLGTAMGLATDAAARVLDADGAPVPGLYACGNDMNSVMNGAYPGPGITLGPALVFGTLAARAIAAGH